MRRHLRHRFSGHERERGAYAVLYAALVVVMIGMSAVVVDYAAVREDRRNNRDATDSAAVGAAEFINPLKTIRPHEACLRAWDYLQSSLDDLTRPAAACNAFSALPGGVTAAAYCQLTPPTFHLIRDERKVGNRTIVVAWPVPKDDATTAADESESFLRADLAPGSIDQEFSPDRDGQVKGCDRIGVAVLEDREFGLGSALGLGTSESRQRTSVHSVARFDASKGPSDQVAALNVLNTRDCRTLVTTGSGMVFVGPTFLNGDYAGPGIIAVESDATGTCNGSATGPGGDRVIDPTTGGALICASDTKLDATLPNAGCDGLGVIQSHAMDSASPRAYRGYPANLRPRPEPEGGVHGWFPVTKKYGCHVITPCMPDDTTEPPYLDALTAAYGGSGIPTSLYAANDPLYTNPYATAFAPVPAAACGAITGTVVLDAGNWYANCSIDIRNGGTLVVKGGSLVVEGGISIAGGSTGGCFVMNINRTNCAISSDVLLDSTGSGTPSPDQSTAHTALDQPSTGILYLRGRSCGSACGFNHQGNLFMAKTFMYAEDSAKELSVNSTMTTFWTAPGAGKIVANSRTALEIDCIVDPTVTPPDKQVVSQDCLNSRFSRLVYWSEYIAPKTKPNTFNGQGSLSVVGVFFTPRAYFNFTGGSTYSSAAAQFWADKLDINGGAIVGLMPDARTAISSPVGAVSLIR